MFSLLNKTVMTLSPPFSQTKSTFLLHTESCQFSHYIANKGMITILTDIQFGYFVVILQFWQISNTEFPKAWSIIFHQIKLWPKTKSFLGSLSPLPPPITTVLFIRKKCWYLWTAPLSCILEIKIVSCYANNLRNTVNLESFSYLPT